MGRFGLIHLKTRSLHLTSKVLVYNANIAFIALLFLYLHLASSLVVEDSLSVPLYIVCAIDWILKLISCVCKSVFILYFHILNKK